MTIPTINHDAITRALNGLGDTADQVAATLHRGGWIGHQISAAECPIGAYLRDVIPDADWYSVSPESVTVGTPGRCTNVAMPPGPAAFVIAFDTDEYPELIDVGIDPDDAWSTADLLLDSGGHLDCGCHSSQREHTCGPLD